jgi:hypothetical protein
MQTPPCTPLRAAMHRAPLLNNSGVKTTAWQMTAVLRSTAVIKMNFAPDKALGTAKNSSAKIIL